MNIPSLLFRWRRRAAAAVTVLSLAGFGAGCAQRVPSGTVVNQSTYAYSISRLDEATIQKPNQEPVVVQVDQSGNVDLGGIPTRAEGLSPAAFTSLLRGYYGKNSTVEIREFRPGRITVLGEVFHQIHTELTDGPMRVMDVIAAANGFTPIANKRRVRLLRQNAGTITVYELDLREMMLGKDLSSNMLLQPGDVITVPRNFL